MALSALVSVTPLLDSPAARGRERERARARARELLLSNTP